MEHTSWINIVLSIEKIFRDLYPDIEVYRFALPPTIEEQRALVEDFAIFLQLVAGPPDRVQDTYCTVWLCEKVTPQQKYLPQENYVGIWLQEQALRLQKTLDDGDPDHAHLWPLYDYKTLLPSPTYDTFLEDGGTTDFSTYINQVPPMSEQSGFVVRAGSTTPSLIVEQNPMYVEWTLVFQHCNPDVYGGMRG